MKKLFTFGSHLVALLSVLLFVICLVVIISAPTQVATFARIAGAGRFNFEVTSRWNLSISSREIATLANGEIAHYRRSVRVMGVRIYEDYSENRSFGSGATSRTVDQWRVRRTDFAAIVAAANLCFVGAVAISSDPRSVRGLIQAAMRTIRRAAAPRRGFPVTQVV